MANNHVRENIDLEQALCGLGDYEPEECLWRCGFAMALPLSAYANYVERFDSESAALAREDACRKNGLIPKYFRVIGPPDKQSLSASLQRAREVGAQTVRVFSIDGSIVAEYPV